METKKNEGLLIKFGQKEHLEDLQNGIIYMHAQEYYSKLNKKDKFKYDYAEGASHFYQKGTVEMKIGEEKLIPMNIANFSKPLKITENKKKKNVMYCLMIHQKKFKNMNQEIDFDKRIIKEYEYYLIFFNPLEFIKKVMLELANNGGKNIRSQKVEYVENDYSGSWNQFYKLKKYNYQKEYRIYCEEIDKKRIGEQEEFIINIGNIAKESQLIKIRS